MLHIVFGIVAVGLGAGSGIWGWSFWWAVLAAMVAGAFGVANGPAYDRVITANRRGSLSTMPLMILAHAVPTIALAGIAYWIASRFS